MRVLIIDDEISTRESIKVLSGFSEAAGDEIFEAHNGVEGYQMIVKTQPDIVFLDMNMPVMDGADLLNLLDEKEFNAKIIVVSGYTDFRYTKAAILKQYVVDYIQKPIDEKQIKSAVQKVTGKEYPAVQSFFDKKKKAEDEIMFGLFIEDFYDVLKENYNGSVELFQYFIMCQAEHQIDELEPFHLDDEIYSYAFFFTVSQEKARWIREALNRVVQNLEQRYQIRAFAIYCEVEGEREKTCMELCEFLNYINLKGEDRIIKKGDVEVRFPESRQETAFYAGELVYYAEKRNQESFAGTVDKMFREVFDSGPVTIYGLKIFLTELLYEISRKMNAKGVSTPKMVSEKMEELYSGKIMYSKEYSQKWLGKLFEEVWQMLKEEEVQIPDKLKQILHYIQGNYHKRISLSEVSELFYFNASTISRMFVKYMGINYIDYVNTLRLEKSKELLDQTGISVSEVAKRTGFESLSYFSKQFKKKYGISPQEYRKEDKAR